ncbi:hypothetical protein RD136_004582 [Salmonella enterica]|nr:hypothetical protein [Salmonella enterica]
MTRKTEGFFAEPVNGRSLLYHIDCGFSNREGIYYARYMDDFLLLTHTRWQLRRCIAELNESLDVSGFEQHPEKTFTGRVTRGFDWPGAWYEAGPPGCRPGQYDSTGNGVCGFMSQPVAMD